MKKGLANLVQAVLVLIALAALFLLLWEPHLEGRNAHATLTQIYFNDPFLAGVYIASIAFFVILYQAFKLAGWAGRDSLVSQNALKALRTIRYCAAVLIGFVVLGEIVIMLHESDDRAGGVFMGNLIGLGAILMVVAAALTERSLRKAIP